MTCLFSLFPHMIVCVPLKLHIVRAHWKTTAACSCQVYKSLETDQKRSSLASFQTKSQKAKEFSWVKSFDVDHKETYEDENVNREKWCTGPMLII